MTEYIERGLLAAMPRRLLLALLLLGGWGIAAQGQVVAKVSDDIDFRFGLLLQSWADWTQDAASEGYAQNVFLRRVRFILLANVAKNVSIFYQTDNPRVGNSGLTGAKNSNTGFETQDVLLEWKLVGDGLMLDAGLFYTPQSRGVLDSSSSNLSFDTPTFGLQQVTLIGGNAGRDWGFGLKGYLAQDHLEYRAGVFSGQRQGTTMQAAPLGPEAGSRNALRVAVRVQYDFFDTEKGYVYVGTNRGAKKILAAGAWADTQGDFQSHGADVMADIPFAGKDAVTVETDYLHYDGGSQFQQIVAGIVTPLLPAQRAFFMHGGYYFDRIKLQPFLRYERLDFRDERFQAGDQQRYGGGLNWYVSGQNLKVSAFYERIAPRVRPTTAAIKDSNHFAVQLQAYSF